MTQPTDLVGSLLYELHGGKGLVAGELRDWLDRDPLVHVLSNSGDELLKLTALKTSLAGSTGGAPTRVRVAYAEACAALSSPVVWYRLLVAAVLVGAPTSWWWWQRL